MKKSYPFYEKLVLFLALVLGYSFQADAQSSSLNETASLNPTSVYASFSINANNQCLVGNRYVMTNNSSSGTYAWDFGDGTTSTEANPSHVYTQAGNFRIHLDVRNGNDYAFSEVFINVMPKPNVDFKILDGTLNGKSFTFITTSTIQSGSMYYWWNLGDGNTSTLVNPTETYATSGNYHVTLIVTSDYGCKDSIQKTVTFNTNCVIPTAAFAVSNNTQCKSNNSFSFTNQSSIMVGADLSYEWNFGDGTTSTDKNPVKSFAQTGTYNVTLTTRNGNSPGCDATATQTINVVGTNAAFTPNPISQQCLNGNSFTMTNSSSSSIKSLFYNWNFGDGTSSTDANPIKIYSNPGTYTIRLIANATEASNCPDTVTHTVTVYPSPTVNFSVNQTQACKLSSHFDFTNQSSVSTGTLNYTWNFGDGTTSTDANPTKVYGAAGTYTVVLHATNNSNGGCAADYSKTVTVDGLKAAFVPNPVSLQCFKNNRFEMTNESSGGGASSLYYQWNLGNGTTSLQTNPVISYATPGTYNITLVAKLTSSNCSDTITWPVTVYPSPTAGFYSNLVSATNTASTIHFINTSSDNGASVHYNWNFNDGGGNNSISGDENATHTFNKNVATRDVKLIAITDHSCTDTLVRTVTLATGLSSGLNNAGQQQNNNNGQAQNNNSNAITSIFPNPFITNIQVNATVSNTSFVTVKIYDNYGRLVASKRENTPSEGNYTISLSVNSLNPGNYLIQLVDHTGSVIGHANALKI